MHRLYTAIIHLRAPAFAGADVEPLVREMRGIHHVEFDASESLLAVDFDTTQTSIAAIVRTVEDSGLAVSGVAQRRRVIRKAG